MTGNLQKRTAVLMVILCGLLCITSATALSQVATNSGPGAITYAGQTIQASDLTILRDGESSTVYTGDDLTVTLTLAYIDGEESYIGTNNCQVYIHQPGEFTNAYSPDTDESDSRASKTSPASIVFHIPGEILAESGTWKATVCWKSATFTDTDGSIYNLFFLVNDYNHIPVITPAYEKIITPTPTQISQIATATPTSIGIATAVPTNIPTPDVTLPEGIPTVVATTPTVVPTGTPTQAASPAPGTTALPTTAPAAPEVPTTTTTGPTTPDATGIPASATPLATLVPTGATETPTPAPLSSQDQEQPGIPFGWIFGVALLVIIVGGGSYLVGTRKKSSISSKPEEKKPEPEESRKSDDAE